MNNPSHACSSSEKHFTAMKLDSLPYLRAVINESLRMRPNSTPLPRVTPPDKVVSVAGIDGIPPGTRINAFQWFVHRDPEKWRHVDEWDPDRWLEPQSISDKHNRESVLWAFASGPRNCLGSNLTYYRTYCKMTVMSLSSTMINFANVPCHKVMQHILAAVFSRFVLTALPRREVESSPGAPEDELPISVSLRG